MTRSFEARDHCSNFLQVCRPPPPRVRSSTNPREVRIQVGEIDQFHLFAGTEIDRFHLFAGTEWTLVCRRGTRPSNGRRGSYFLFQLFSGQICPVTLTYYCYCLLGVSAAKPKFMGGAALEASGYCFLHFLSLHVLNFYLFYNRCDAVCASGGEVRGCRSRGGGGAEGVSGTCVKAVLVFLIIMTIDVANLLHYLTAGPTSRPSWRRPPRRIRRGSQRIRSTRWRPQPRRGRRKGEIPPALSLMGPVLIR